MTDPQSGVTSYVYDTLNRLSTLTPPTAFTSGSFGFSYDALSRRTQMTRPNGVTTNYTYNTLSQLLSVLHQVGASTIDGATYTVDPVGNRTAKTDNYANVTSNYTYDPLYELTQVTQATNTTESYSYDPVGNRLSSLGVSPYSVNSSNELSSTPSVTYTYDNNGNTLTKVTSAGATTYGWDYENRLTSATLPGTGGTLAFKYDALGHRVQKAFTQNSSTTTTNYLYDGNNAVADVDQNGNVLARYAMTQNIDEPLAELRSGTTSYYSQDGLGSVTSLTTSTGALGNTYRYDSFGNVTVSTGSVANRFQYTARELDPEIGLYYYRARYYDSTIGRFVSEDPLGYSVGENFYRYVSNRPTLAVDPTGLVRVIPLPDSDIYTLADIDASCKSRQNPTGVTAGGCNKVTYTVNWTGCESCDHTPQFTITLLGAIYVASGPFPYKGRNPADRSIVSTATALAHEQGHTSDMVAAIVPIFQGAEHHYGSQEECEAAAEEAALRAGPAWESAAANSQRRRH